jgi:hypothetical protein
MKKINVVIGCLLINCCFIFAQGKIVKIKGDTLNVQTVKVYEKIISFTYPSEDQEFSISKKGVREIMFPSGRIEKVSEEIDVTGKNGFEKVIVTRNADDVAGLKEVQRINTKSERFLGKEDVLRKKALENLKREAAQKGAFIIHITTDVFSTQPICNVTMEGIAYSY